MTGHKLKWETRALEFHGRLATWKQMLESARPSLRALAARTRHLTPTLRPLPAKLGAMTSEYRRRAEQTRSCRGRAPHSDALGRTASQCLLEAFQAMIESLTRW